MMRTLPKDLKKKVKEKRTISRFLLSFFCSRDFSSRGNSSNYYRWELSLRRRMSGERHRLEKRASGKKRGAVFCLFSSLWCTLMHGVNYVRQGEGVEQEQT